MNIKSLAVSISALVLSTSVNSALIDIDWQAPGDSHIIRDTISGLDWLDLSETANLSHKGTSIN